MHFRLVPTYFRPWVHIRRFPGCLPRRYYNAGPHDKPRTRFGTAFSHEELRGAPVTPTFVAHVGERLRTVRQSLGFTRQQHLDGISLSEFIQWSSVISASNFEEAMKIDLSSSTPPQPANLLGTPNVSYVENKPKTESPPFLPEWVLLYLLSTKVYSPDQANLAFALALRYLPSSDAKVRPSLLILVARALAKHQTSPPLSSLINAFVELPMSRQALHFNLLLRAMSHFHPSVEMAKFTTVVLDAMQSRQISLHSRTYRSLLDNRLVTLELTKILQAKMIREGFRPNVEHLEAFLTVFGKHGYIHDAGQYLDAIRFLKLKRGQAAPYGTVIEPDQTHKHDAVMRWNTEYLRAHVRNPGAAFQYLRSLVGAEKDRTPPDPLAHSRQRKMRNASPRFGTWKTTIGVRDWNVTVDIAARDKKTTADSLLRLFEQSKKLSHGPNVACYTIILRGLLKRKEYSAALAVWEELRERKGRLDKMALTVGLDVLTSAGRALQAFELLEEVIAKSKLLNKPRSVSEQTRRTVPDIIILNSFMTSLTRSGRPDVVFQLWDCLESVYNVKPDTVTLILLLRSARAAKMFDHSLRALWAHVAVHSPFATSDAADKATSREAQVASLRVLLGSEYAQGKITSLWGNMPAVRRARDIFRQVVLGNWPHLREIPSPATAVWSDAAQTHGPVRDFVRGVLDVWAPLPSEADAGLQDVRKGDLLAETGLRPLGPYPQIVPDAKAFHAYIELLGSLAFSSEIPVTLAWMRALEITPQPKTLSLALVLWGEVSIRGPLLEEWTRWSEYNRFLRWLEGWVGDDAVPKEKDIDRTFKMLMRQREQK